MAYFPNLSDLNRISMWKRAHKNSWQRGRGRLFNVNLMLIRRTRSRAGQSDFFSVPLSSACVAFMCLNDNIEHLDDGGGCSESCSIEFHSDSLGLWSLTQCNDAIVVWPCTAVKCYWHQVHWVLIKVCRHPVVMGGITYVLFNYTYIYNY